MTFQIINADDNSLLSTIDAATEHEALHSLHLQVQAGTLPRSAELARQ